MSDRRCEGNLIGVTWVIAGSLVLVAASGCSGSPAAGPEPARPVKTMVVAAGGETQVRSFPGRVEASRAAELAFQVPGLLVSIPIKEGQRVAKGELIAQLRQDAFQAELKVLQGQLDQARAVLGALRSGERPEQRLRLESQVRAAEARMANARSELDRSAALLKIGGASRENHERAETAYRVAQEEHQASLQMLEKGTIARAEDIEAQKGAVRALEAKVVGAQIQLDDSTLHAPYDGVIAQRFVEEQQNVRAKQPVVKFQDVDEVIVAVYVPETIMARIRVADIVQLMAEFDVAPGIQFPVELSEIAQTADPKTQTFRVRVALAAPADVNLRPGMTASVTLTYRRARILGDRIRVPISAVSQDSGGEQIAWVIGEDLAVSRRAVQLGEAAGGQIEIVAGLQPGERIAVAGVTFLREGMKVRDLGDALGGRPVMNPGVFSVRHNRVVFAAMALLLVGGFVAYQQIGRLEDPEFTIKEALIITPYPGASADEVAKEVTNPIENAVQQLGQLDYVESESSRGRSVVSAIIKDRYDRHRIPQVWDELRRKIADVQSSLPPAVRGRSVVVDDFGDVYGIFLAITGEGYSFPELRRYAEFLRRELLLVPNVKKVELFAEQQEMVFLEISRPRLAGLRINEEEIYAKLRDRNVAADGGRVRVGDQHVAIDPHGAFGSAEEMLELVIGSHPERGQIRLKDVATIQRGDQDPPRRMLRYDGQPAIGLGISTVQGGNVVTLGEGVRRKLEDLKPSQPLGIEIGEINFQPEAVTAATSDFIWNLAKAVSIVFVVLIFAMGRKTGLIIGLVLFLTIMATFFVMYVKGDLLMERISLGALIIALCMLTDNAIIVIEGVKVGIEAGKNKLDVVRDVVAENQWPLFGATAIGVIAFAAIGLSEDSTGEYCNSLFWVILISLSLSWVSSITITPLLSYLFFKPTAGGASGGSGDGDPYQGKPFQVYRRLLVLALRHRWAVVGMSVAGFVLAVYGFGWVKQSFFPPATRPQFMVDVFLPAGTHIRETEQFAAGIQQYLQARPGVTHVTSFIGGGGLRFLLVYAPEGENRAFVQFLVDVDDWRKTDALLADAQQHLDEQHPNANAVAKKFLLGPGAGGRVQVRLQGPDPEKLRQLADQAMQVLQDDGGAVCVRSDWRERTQAIRPEMRELQARRTGITRVEVAQALESSFEGRMVGFYREPGYAGGGVFPQETRLLPIVARPPLAERGDVEVIHSLQIWSPVAQEMIPLNQVTAGAEVVWEDPVVMRRDRFPTLTVHADPRTGLPSQLHQRIRPAIEALELPPGYSLAWGGEYEDSRQARAALAEPLPYVLALMVFIVVCLFNSVRTTLLIWLIMPLAIIGVTSGLLLTGQPFGFMALLGVLSLGGEQIKNQIVVLSKIVTEINHGKAPYQALLDGGTAKMRPVCMVAITTVLGMIPLLVDPFFGSMAVCIMFGLSFAAVLSLIVTPVLYAIFFNVHETGGAPAAKAPGPRPTAERVAASS